MINCCKSCFWASEGKGLFERRGASADLAPDKIHSTTLHSSADLVRRMMGAQEDKGNQYQIPHLKGFFQT